MSEMIRNHGIIKELFANKKTVAQKAQALADQLGLPLEEIATDYGNGDWEFKDWNTYTFINKRLFDISGAPDERDYESGDIDNVTKVAEGVYQVDLYYYNGGTCMEEIVAEKLDDLDSLPVEPSYYAVKRANGQYITRDNSICPALWSSKAKAEATVKKHFFGLLDDGYEVVRFGEINA